MTRTPPLVWFGIAAPPLAWALQLWLGYAIEEAACSPGGAEGSVWGASPERLIVAVSLAAALTTVLALAGSIRIARTAGDDPRGRVRFMAAAGALGGVLFLLLIALGFLLPASLGACDAG